MHKKNERQMPKAMRRGVFLTLVALLVAFAAWSSNRPAEANHPVLLEGNCDSPTTGTITVPTVPGTGGSTSGGICGDYDGDGRIGTAEDTDGADRIFGTLTAALGPGTGAAAGTGANYNGTILIVASGRFSEPPQVIGNPVSGLAGGTATPSNVTIEAAPGVIANIDAVLQGDTAGGNTDRQQKGAFLIYYATANNSAVTLRNLNFRNYFQAIGIAGFSNVLIDNCRFENNLGAGVNVDGPVRLIVTRSQFQANGRRLGAMVSATPSPGDGITLNGNPIVKIFDTTFTLNSGAGIRNNTVTPVTLYKVATYLNGTNTVGPMTISPDPNYSQE